MSIKVTQLSVDLRHVSGLDINSNGWIKEFYKFLDSYNISVLEYKTQDTTEVYKKRTCIEYCSECETEVEILMNKKSNCPNCNESILPCSMCVSCTIPCVFD